MGERKDDATDELDDENLSEVTGGAGVAGSTESAVSVTPGPPDVTAPPPVGGAREAGTGMATGKRSYGAFVIKKDPDPTMQ